MAQTILKRKRYKIPKEIVRKYYKYTTISWTQPVLSANGTLGGNAFACWASSENAATTAAWYAFNGVITTANSNYWSAAGGVVPADLVFYNHEALNVTNLRITNNYYSSQQGVTAGIVYGSNDNSTWTELKQFTNTAVASNAQWNIDLSDNTGFYKYYKIHVTDTSFVHNNKKYIQIMDVTITATQQVVTESTESDYDFYKDVDSFKTLKTTERKYYKYVEESWIQPTLSADGTLGGNSFACWTSSNYNSNYHAYLAFNGIQDTGGNYGGWETAVQLTTANFKFYNPVPLKVTSIGYTAISGLLLGGTIYGSNDNTNWEKLEDFLFESCSTSSQNVINITNPKPFKYYKIQCSSRTATYYGISELYITATQVTQIIDGTSDDYDYYIDDTNCKALPENYKIKVIPVIPVMTSNTEPYGTASLVAGKLYTGKQPYFLFTPNGSAYTYTGSFTIRYTFDVPISAGRYTASLLGGGGSYQYRVLKSFSILFHYTDGTSETLVSWSGSVSGLQTFTYDIIIPKSVDYIEYTGTGTSGNVNYGFVLYNATLTRYSEI